MILEAGRDGVGVAHGHAALHPLALVVARQGLALGVDHAHSVEDDVFHGILLRAQDDALAVPGQCGLLLWMSRLDPFHLRF